MKPARPAAFLTIDQIEIGSFEAGARAAADIVVVIDVFRAFTTAAMVLRGGASRIVMTGDLADARRLRDEGVGRICIGERGDKRPEGFDFGNSPVEADGVAFAGETVIQTTTNGTRGVLAAEHAGRVYAGALVTADATVAAILARRPRTVALAAMGDRARAEEDEICALYLRSRLLGLSPDKTAVAAAIRSLSHRAARGSISEADADACLAIGTIPFAVRVKRKGCVAVAIAEAPEQALSDFLAGRSGPLPPPP